MLMTHPSHNLRVPLVSATSESLELDSSAPDAEVSPEEVSRRILEVRSSWNVRERMVRRRAAADRFEHLVAVLAEHESH